MRKTLFLTLFLCLSMFAVFAQDSIVLADYEVGSAYPNRTSAWDNSGNSGLSVGIDNPDPDGINGSPKVSSLHITTQSGQAVVVDNFDEPIRLGAFPFVKFKIRSDSAVSKVATVKLYDVNNVAFEVNYNLPANIDVAWTDAIFDFTNMLGVSADPRIKKMEIKFDFNQVISATNTHNIYYFDDIRFTNPQVTLDVATVLAIYYEQFSINAWWMSGAPGGSPGQGRYVAQDSTFGELKTAEWGGYPFTAPEKHYTATDSILMEMILWGNSSIRLDSSDRPGLNHITIKELDISGYQNLSFSYDLRWLVAPASFSESPTVEYSLDGGGTWTGVTTSSPLPGSAGDWDGFTTGITYDLSAISDNNLVIRVTNNTIGSCHIDNMKLTGTQTTATAKIVSGIDVQTSDNTNTFDVKGATKQMVPNISPATANQNVEWSLINSTGKASISTSGELTPMKNGTVKVIARALDIYGTMRDTQEVVLTNQLYPVTAIDIVGEDTLKTDNGQAAYTFNITPWDADTTTYSVSLVDSAGNSVTNASYDNGTKTLTAIKNGYVIIVATADDYMHVTDSLTVILEGQTFIPVTSISLSGGNTISTGGGTLQLTANYTPVDADIQNVIWSITDETGSATISDEGLVTAVTDGTVTAKATYTDNSSVFGEVQITITGQVGAVTAMSISSANTIATNDGIIKLLADFTPADAYDKDVTWSIVGGNSNIASISNDTLTALRNGTVTVNATYNSNTSITDEMAITITNQVIELTAIEITGNNITTNAGTSQMTAVLTPADAENVEVKWSLSNAADSLKATITTTGLVTAYRNGTITVVAKDANSVVMATKTITISGQILVNTINLTTAGGATSITENGGTLQVSAEVLPADARIKDIVWSIVKVDGNATVSNTGLVSAIKDGDVYVKVKATDDSAYADSILISISGQILVQSVDILVATDTIKVNNQALTLAINVSPDNAADTTVTWSIISNDADTATINAETGLITPIRNGSIKILAVANGDETLKDSAIVVITNQVVEPTAIVLMGADSAKTIAVNNGTLAMHATVNPSDAEENVIWGIQGDKFDIATIDSTGLVTAIRNGVIFVQVSSTVDPTVSDKYEISITNQVVEPTSIAIHSEGDVSIIDENDGTLAFTIEVTPADAVTDVVWSILSQDADTAAISTDGILTALRNGTVTIQAVSTVSDTVKSTFNVTISNQVIEPTSISIVGTDSISIIDINDGTLALLVNVTPADAVNTVVWSISSTDADTATINEEGIVKALRNGIASVMAVSTVDSTVSAQFDIAISNQVIEPIAIVVKGEGDVSEIDTLAGTLQMIATVTPNDAVASVVWSIASGGEGLATLSETGLLTAVANGTVTVIAQSTSVDSIKGQIDITISGQEEQVILVSEIVVMSENDSQVINVKAGTLQLTATVNPDDATDSTVTWSVDDELIATVSELGLVTAIADGVVTVTATANDGSGVTGTIELTISNQGTGITSNAVNTLYVYPNPVKNTLSINNLKQAAKVEIINSNGAVVNVTNEFNYNNTLDVQMLKSGVYVIRAIANEKVYQGVFVKE